MTSTAVCILASDQGVRGIINFTQISEQETRVTATITGLAPGLHGFHIHQFGDLTNGCASCGGHFNPEGKQHGGPTDIERHAGDLGNIIADHQGIAKVNLIDRRIPLHGPNSILGRSIVVHAGEDDLGKGNNDESKKTGNAGARAACGVIAFSQSASTL